MLPCHDDPSVNFVSRIQEMHITGRHDRFMELFAKFHDFAVDFHNVFH